MTLYAPPPSEQIRTAATFAPTASTGRVRVMTYNVRRCFGRDGAYSPERIARVIAQSGAQVIALQELDVNRGRSGTIDQALAIAAALGMTHHFHPAMSIAEEQYGDAILSALPLRLIKAGALPSIPRHARLEPRGALWVEVALEDRALQVITTHFGLLGHERVLQAEALTGPDWLGHPACRAPVVVVGDFNAIPRSKAYRRMTRDLQDVQKIQPFTARATFPSAWPLLRIDHAFVSKDLLVRDVVVLREGEARVASDHLPLCVDLEVPPAGSGDVA